MSELPSKADIDDAKLNVSKGPWSCKNGLRDVSLGSQDPGVSQATIAVINGLTPTMLMTRVRL